MYGDQIDFVFLAKWWFCRTGHPHGIALYTIMRPSAIHTYENIPIFFCLSFFFSGRLFESVNFFETPGIDRKKGRTKGI